VKRIDHYWYSQNPVAWSLLPLSWLFCAIAIIRRFLYQKKIFASSKLDKPVIIVGNITVGGSGKTPLLIALCKLLKDRGYNPGVISRGYMRSSRDSVASHGVHQLSDEDTAENVGDEPLLIARQTRCPVVVGQDRAAAGRYLLKHNHCDFVLSDDGLQHYRLQRDYEIAVVDSVRGFGNGFCIPAGPLRETLSRLDSVDEVVTHQTGQADVETASGFRLEFADPVNLLSGESTSLDALKAAPVHAVAGIGHPQRFFKQLKANGFGIIEHAFPDHHQYQADELSFGENAVIIMTEKDAVKCKTLGLSNAWFISVTARLTRALESKLMARNETLAIDN